MEDEAQIDDALVTTALLEVIDTPHIKALERLFQAQTAASQAG